MKKLIAIFITLFYFNGLSAQKYTYTYIRDANKIGLEWWSQVNNAQYEISYENLSDVLKSRATLKDWLNQISMLMDEFGEFKKRTVRDTYFKSELEGFEDGFYVMIEYDVEYSKTKNHTEYLLLRQNDKFEWQILDFNYTFQSLEATE